MHILACLIGHNTEKLSTLQRVLPDVVSSTEELNFVIVFVLSRERYLDSELAGSSLSASQKSFAV